MDKKFKKLLIGLGLAGILLFLLFSLKSPQIRASASDNVSGWAWSENIGWISFNCVNTDCGSSNYGVSIDEATGDFSKYAWSENIGWIQFNPSGPYPSSPNHSAKLDFGTGYVTGWARALAHGDGWDGWIKMKKDPSDGGADYGVYFNSSTKEFEGWAWGSDVIGWISFNCYNDYDGDGIPEGHCVSEGYLSDYSVSVSGLNIAPNASSLTVSDPSSSYYCPSSPLGSHLFRWIYSDTDGDHEAKFQFQVDDKSNFSDCDAGINCEVSRLIPETGSLDLPNGSPNNQSVTVVNGGGADKLDYGKTYYWRVKVFDSGSPQQDSGWIEGPSFQTANHAYPKVDFSWSPLAPSKDKNTDFTDESEAYGSGNPIQSWNWQFENGNPPNFDCVRPGCVDPNVSVIFTQKGNNNVSLNATDKDGYSCQTSKTIRVIQEIKIKEI